MREFEFKGKWKTKVNLPILSVLRHSKFYKRDSHLEWIRDKANSLDNQLVDLNIRDAPNKNEHPELIQLDAINHILQNENDILNEIFRVMKEIVYPYYGDLVGEDYQEQDPLKEVNDLKDCLAINEIMVDFIGKENIAWVTYIFESNVDPEHGLSMLFQGSKFLKHDSAYDMMYQDLLTKDEYDQYIKDINIANDSDEPKMHYPDNQKKYFKPWELEQTKGYLTKLLQENKDEEFKELINKEEFDINIKFPELNHTLLEEVLRIKKIDIAKYMVKKGASTNKILHQGNIYYENKTRIQLIGELGYNINELNPSNQTLLDRYFEIADREYRRDNSERIKLLEEHVRLLIQYGAKINNPDKYIGLIKYWKLNNNGNGGWFRKLFK